LFIPRLIGLSDIIDGKTKPFLKAEERMGILNKQMNRDRLSIDEAILMRMLRRVS